jgi:hypothetical protein
MIDPDTGGCLNTDGVTSVSEYLADLDVADDNVINVQDANADASEC